MALLHRLLAAKKDSDESSIRGYDIEYIVQCVSRVEGYLKRAESSGRAFSKYIKIKEWLVQERYLSGFIIRSIFRHSKRKIPLFCLDSTIQGLAKGVLLFVSARRHIGETSAQAIRVKNNVRAFFTNGVNPFVVKMLISQHRSLENMETEINARSRVSTYATVKVPRILSSALTFDPPFFQEEIMWGEKPVQGKDDLIISDILCPQIWSTYEKNGLKFRSLGEVVDLVEFYEGLARSLDSIPWLQGYGDKTEFLSRVSNLLKMDGLLPCSFVHGDLCLGNIIVTPEKQAYLVDWEQTGEGPIAFDLYELITEFPGSRKYIELQMDDLAFQNRNIDLFPFHLQLCIAALKKIKKWSSNYYRVTPRRLPGLKGRLWTTIRYVDELMKESKLDG